MLNRDDKDGSHMGKRSVSLWAVLLVVLGIVILGVFIVRPSIIGYSVYQQVAKSNYSVSDYAGSIQDLQNDVDIARVNTSLYAEQFAHIEDLHTEVTNSLSQCVEERASLGAELNASLQANTDEIARLRADVEEKKSAAAAAELARNNVVSQMTAERESLVAQTNSACDAKVKTVSDDIVALQSDYDALVLNTAKNVCCKAKIDNPGVDSYDVLSDKVVCISGGEKTLVC